MSVESMAIALHHSRASGAAKLILIGIANHDGDGGAWPSMATLAKYGHCNVRNARAAVERLEALGEVERAVQAGGNAFTADHMRPNLYEFKLHCPSTCDGTKRHRNRAETVLDMETPTPPVAGDRGVVRDRGGRSQATSEPSNNQIHPVKEKALVPKRAREAEIDASGAPSGPLARWAAMPCPALAGWNDGPHTLGAHGYCVECFEQPTLESTGATA